MLNQSLELMFLLVALIAFYISSRAAADALDRHGTGSPGRQALGYALPIAAVAFGAGAAGYAQLAVAVIFSASVAALALVAALCMLIAHSNQVEPEGAWTLLLPAAFITWIIGFQSHLSWLAIIVLFLEGLAILAAWNRQDTAGEKDAKPGESTNQANVSPSGASSVLRILQLLLAIVLAGIGVWAIVRTGHVVTRQSYFVTWGLFATAVVAPLVALPMIGAGLAQVQRGQLHVALGSQVGTVLLSLCLILPLTGVISWVFHRHQPLIGIPLGTWRIDNVALVILGLAMLCVGTRILRPTKLLGGLLLIGYLAYLLLSLRAAVGI